MDSLMITPQDLELDYDIDDYPSLDEIYVYIEANAGVTITSSPLNARDTLYSNKISIRIPHYVLTEIKLKASEMGLPYQTLINVILNEYVAGKVKL